MSMTLIFNLCASSVGFAVGSVYLKRYADHGAWLDLGGAFLVFGLSNLVYAQVLAKGLGQGAVLGSMAHLILMSVAGVLLFGERMGIYHVAGLVSALATIWLFTLANHAG
ncbi:MAG: hypothetical protein ACRBCT_04185 [Alphaproteobacteria bacterium]